MGLVFQLSPFGANRQRLRFMLLCLSYLKCAYVCVSTQNTAVLCQLMIDKRPAMRRKNSYVCFREKAITVTVKGLTCFPATCTLICEALQRASLTSTKLGKRQKMSCCTLQIIPNVNYTPRLLSLPVLGSEKHPTAASVAEVTSQQLQVPADEFNHECLRASRTNVGYSYGVFSRTWGAGSSA